MRTSGLFRRQLRADAAALVTLAAILFVTTLLAAGLPRWLNAADDDALRHEVRTSVELDDVVGTFTGAPASGPNGVAALGNIGDDLAAQFEAPLGELLDDPVLSVFTRPFELVSIEGVTAPGGAPALYAETRLVMTSEPAVRYVEGVAPAASDPLLGPFPTLGPEYEDPEVILPVIEIAVVADAATALGTWRTEPAVVGDELIVSGAAGPLVLRVVGIFEAIDDDAYAWQRNFGVLGVQDRNQPGVTVGSVAGALVTPESFVDLTAASGSPFNHQWQYPLDIDRLDSGIVGELLESLNRLETIVVPVGTTTMDLQTSLQRPIGDFLEQRATAHAVLFIGVAGLLVSALAVLVLAAQLTTERRRTALALARSRGATLRQLVLLSGAEGLLIAALSCLPAAALAVLVVDGRATSVSWWLTGLLMAATTATLAGIVGWEHRLVGKSERHDLVVQRVSPRRLGAEIALVALAVSGAVLLRQRGFDASVVAGASDPFLTAVPVLLALAASLVVLRLYPFPVRLLGRLATRRRGSVGFLGLSRAGRAAAGAAVPLVVLLVALSFSVFASVVLNSVRIEQEVVAWQEVGAETRVDGTGFDVNDRVPVIAEAAGVTMAETVGVHVAETSALNEVRGQGDEFELLLLDTAEVLDLFATRPIATADLQRLDAAPAGDGTAVPALVSPAFVEDILDGELADVQIFLPGTDATLVPIDVTDAFPGVDPDERFAIARVADARQVVDTPYFPSVLLLDAPGVDLDSVRAAVYETQPFASVTTRQEVYEVAAEAPLVNATETAFGAAVLVAAGYCALAVVLALVVTARPRSRFLSYLRTLGLSGRQARGLVALEILPMAGVAAAGGLLLGLGIPRVVAPAIDLRPFTGGLDAPPLLVDGAVVAALTLGLLIVVVAAILIVTAVNRRLRLGSALRVGEDA